MENKFIFLHSKIKLIYINFKIPNKNAIAPLNEEIKI